MRFPRHAAGVPSVTVRSCRYFGPEVAAARRSVRPVPDRACGSASVRANRVAMHFQCPTPFPTLAITPLRSASIAIWQALRTAPYRHDRTVTSEQAYFIPPVAVCCCRCKSAVCAAIRFWPRGCSTAFCLQPSYLWVWLPPGFLGACPLCLFPSNDAAEPANGPAPPCRAGCPDTVPIHPLPEGVLPYCLSLARQPICAIYIVFTQYYGIWP